MEEAREEVKAQEMRREKSVQEAREKEAKAQGERRREVRKEERGSEEREVEARRGKKEKKECTRRGGRGRKEGEVKDAANSDPHGQRTTLADGARPSKSVASSHKSRAGSARDKKGLRERKGEMGDGKQRKQCKYTCSRSSSSSDGAPAMIL